MASGKIAMIQLSLQEAEMLSKQAASEQQWQHAHERYRDAMNIYNHELDEQERAVVQERILQVQEGLSQTHDRLQAAPGPRRAPSFLLRRSSWMVAILAVLVLFVVSSGVVYLVQTANAAFHCTTGSIDIEGSTALKPLLTDISADYKAEYRKNGCSAPGFTIVGNASITGLNRLESGQSDIGASDIFALPGQEDLQDHQIAATVFAVIVNTAILPTGTHTLNLSSAQLRAIYTGQCTNWSQLPGWQGPNLANIPVVPLGRTANSGTRYTFQQYVLKGLQTTIGTEDVASSQDAVLEVAATQGAISYTTLDKALHGGPNVAIVAIDGVVPSRASVINNQYNFWNIEHLYTRAKSSAATQAFIRYVFQDVSKRAHDTQYQGYLTPNEVTPQMKASHPQRT